MKTTGRESWLIPSCWSHHSTISRRKSSRWGLKVKMLSGRNNYKYKQHAHAEIVTVTVAVLIQIKLAIVNNLKLFTISQIVHNFSNCSQFLKFFTVVYNAALQKLHLSMLSSVRLCCLSEIALILVLFSEFSWNRLQKSWKIWNSAAPRFQIFHSFFRRFHSNSEKSTLISCNFT